MSVTEVNGNLNVEAVPLLDTVTAFAGLPAKQVREIDPAEYDLFQAISNKMNGGFRGMIDLILYAGFTSLFVSILVSNNSVFNDVGNSVSGITVPFDSTITDYTSNMQYIFLIGVGLCLIRLVFANHFVKEAQVNRIFELVWSVIIWILFIVAIIFSSTTQDQLNKSATTNAADASKVARIGDAKKQITSQMTLCGIGIASSTLLTGYGIYDMFAPLQVEKGADPNFPAAGAAGAAPAPAPTQ